MSFTAQTWKLVGTTGKMAGRGTMVTLKYASCSLIGLATLTAPFAGLYAGYETDSKELMMSDIFVAPLAIGALNYALAQAQIFARTSPRLFFNRKLNSAAIAQRQKIQKENNDFFSNMTTLSAVWFTALTAIEAAVVIGFPYGILPTFMMGIVGTITGGAVGIELYAPISNHFDSITRSNIKKLRRYSAPQKNLWGCRS